MFFLGIDLGTTNCSVAYSRGEMVEDFAILQSVGENLFEKRYQLPSYAFLMPEEEEALYADYPFFGELKTICGYYAKSLCEKRSARVVQSAKSWISLSNSNSCNHILPFSQQQSSIRKLSPVEASALYLRHIRLALGDLLDEGQVVITVPASFDELARRLTIEAAELAGFAQVLLLEEPQAAFYNWLYYEKEEKNLRTVLVIDIGGGTTDFSLLKAEGVWKRAAVGNHILLGGDNIDLAIALKKEAELNRRFTADELEQVVAISRELKERFLDGLGDEQTYHLKGSGSRLFSSEIKLKFSRAEIEGFILDGFFPILPDFKSVANTENITDMESGLREFGLPYEKNPAFSHHLREFLQINCPQGPDAVLFHGGTLQSELMRRRLAENLRLWFKKDIRILKNPHPLLGVSHGACIYALARHGKYDLIQSGLPHNYYLQAELGRGQESCFCVALAGQLEGQKNSCPQLFQLKGNQQVLFPFYRDNSIEPLPLGAEKPVSELCQLPSLSTKLPAHENYFPVYLSSELMPTGELKIYLNNSRQAEEFVLNFELRQLANQRHRVLKVPKEVEELLRSSFGRGLMSDVPEKKALSGLFRRLEKMMQLERLEWGLDLCRHLGRILLDRQRSRRKSAEHERLWFNMAGFLWRPGFGHPLDGDLSASLDISHYTAFPNSVQNRVEYWIFLRRVSGALSDDFQKSWFYAYGHYVIGGQQRGKLPSIVPKQQELDEMLRAFVSFEHLTAEQKEALFQEVFRRLRNGKLLKSEWWLLARLLSRRPNYAPFTEVLSPDLAVPFFTFIKKQTEFHCVEMRNILQLLFAQKCDRRLCFPLALIDELSDVFQLRQIEDRSVAEEQKFAFGETLPLGLKLYSV